MSEKTNSTVWLYVKNEDIAEKTFKGTPYTTKDGQEKVPDLRGVTTNLLIDNQVYKASLSVRDQTITPAENKEGLKSETASRIPLDADVQKKVRLSHHEETGWVNEDRQLTGKEIVDYHKAYTDLMREKYGKKDEKPSLEESLANASKDVEQQNDIVKADAYREER